MATPPTGAKKAIFDIEMRRVERDAEADAARKLKEFQDALAAAPPADLDSPLAKGFAKAKMGTAEKDDLVKFIQDTRAKAIADATPKEEGFDITVGGETHRVGPDAPVPMTTGLIPDAGGATGAFGGGEFEIGSEVGPSTRIETDLLDPSGNPVFDSSGKPMKKVTYENPTKATIAPATLSPQAGAALAKGLLDKKQKRTELSKDFGKALRTGLETLTGEARQANVTALRDENFNRVGRKMLKGIEDERTRAKIDFLRSPEGSTVSAPGIDRLKEMQGRAFGTSTALRGSVGRLGDAPRSLGTERGRLRKGARALERRGYRSGGGQLRGAAALTGEPGISTPAHREGQQAAEAEIADLQKRLIEAHIANQEAAARRNNNRPTVNPNASPGAGYGTPINE